MSWKQRFLDAAEVLDSFRIRTTALLIAYCWFIYEVTWYLLSWYVALPAAERSLEASGMAVGIFTAITGFGTAFLNAFLKAGRKWNEGER